MNQAYYFPQIFRGRDIAQAQNASLIDQLFNLSFPWKLLNDISDNRTDLTNFRPKLDASSDDKNYMISIEIPGINCDDVKLEVKNGTLIFSGEKKSERTSDDGKHEHLIERSFGSFYRELTLPEDADQDNIQATHKDGVLNIVIPKIVQKNNRNIAIDRK